MKILKKIVLWLVIVIVAVSLLAQLLPGEWKVVRETIVSAPPEKVYPEIASVRAWEKWSAFMLEDPEIEIAYSGPESGVGSQGDWKSKKFGDGGAKITQAFEPSGIEYNLYFAAREGHSVGRILLTELEDGGTRVTYAVEGDNGRNPAYRIMGFFFSEKFLGAFFERSLASLKSVVEAK